MQERAKELFEKSHSHATCSSQGIESEIAVFFEFNLLLSSDYRIKLNLSQILKLKNCSVKNFHHSLCAPRHQLNNFTRHTLVWSQTRSL